MYCSSDSVQQRPAKSYFDNAAVESARVIIATLRPVRTYPEGVTAYMH